MSEAAIAAAHHAFDAPVEPRPGGRLRIGGLEYLYDRSEHPPFVLVPACDRCGSDDVALFPLETWAVDGVAVRAQARATCRDCRFLSVASDRSAINLRD